MTMLHILAEISISGRKSALSTLVENSVIPNGELMQLGLLRKHPPPPADSWMYSSPYYRFNLEKLDEELYDFLSRHHFLEACKLNENEGIDYPLLTIIPVDKSFEEIFACVLSHKTLLLLSKLGLGLQIAPAMTMPEASFWIDHA
jgi:hypothetical protein